MLVDLHDGEDYVWETCSKIAGIMSLVFSFVDHNQICSIRNPLDKVTIPASEEDQDEVKVLLPEQVIALLERLPYPVKIAVLLVASTGIRISESLGLTWKDVEWANNRIFIHQTFRRGESETDEDQGQQSTRPDVCRSGSVPHRLAAANPVHTGRELHFCLADAEGWTATRLWPKK